MSSLSNAEIQTSYVAKIRELWSNWGRLSQNRRRGKLHVAVNSTLRSCNLPQVSPLLDTNGTPQLVAASWKIKFPSYYLTDGISVDEFARGATTLYHEARHSEQWYRIAQGIAAGKFLLPSVLAPRPAVTPQTIATQCSIALATVQHANQNKNSYPQQMDRMIREWYRSIYGFNRPHRGQVLEHLDWSSYHNKVPDNNFAQYLNLPEEKDAYLMQDEVLARLSNHLNMWPRP